MGDRDVVGRGALKPVPVVETFGPTIQGEGPLAGLPTYFVRLGLCDYRCSWCDSMYAVDPVQVREGSVKMDEHAIVDAIRALPLGPQWVTLSGGNPAIHDLGDLVRTLNAQRLMVAVETQGSRWRDWLDRVQKLVVSPKPPSSGMATDRHVEETARFLDRAEKSVRYGRRALKIVVFDEADFAWAKALLSERTQWEAHLSVGTPIPEDQPLHQILARFQWLAERVASDMALRHVRVLPQLHVLAWGQVRGV